MQDDKEPLRRLTPPPHPFRGGNFVYRVFYNRFSLLKGEMSALLTEGFQPTNNNLPTYKRTQQSVPRRLGAAKPHIFRAVSTENTKPQVLSAAVLPSDEASPEAARLTAAYNLQATRHRKVTSADDRFPTPQCKSATLITHYALRITHFHSPTTASGIQHLISNIKKASSLLQAPKMLFH